MAALKRFFLVSSRKQTVQFTLGRIAFALAIYCVWVCLFFIQIYFISCKCGKENLKGLDFLSEMEKKTYIWILAINIKCAKFTQGPLKYKLR